MKISMSAPSNRVNRVARLIVNPDTGPIYCCWDTCDKRARSIWDIRLHEHPQHIRCSDVEQAGGLYGRHAHMTFCSQQHAEFWAACSGKGALETAARNQGRIYGQAPEGSRIGRLR